MNKNEYESLKTFGYTLIKNVIPSETLKSIRARLEEQFEEEEINNSLLHSKEDQIILKNVFIKSPEIFLPLLDLNKVTSILAVVFKDGYTLQSMNASRANPTYDKEHELFVHIDSRLPSIGIEHTLALGIAFCIDDFTEKNGATRVWPFSHLSGLRPDEALKDGLKLPPSVLVEAEPGDAFVFLAQLWHAVGPNRTINPRWGIFTFFNPWWIKPTWDYKECGESMFSLLSEHQKQLFGFTTQTPSMNSTRTLTKSKIEDLPDDYLKAKNIE